MFFLNLLFVFVSWEFSGLSFSSFGVVIWFFILLLNLVFFFLFLLMKMVYMSISYVFVVLSIYFLLYVMLMWVMGEFNLGKVVFVIFMEFLEYKWIFLFNDLMMIELLLVEVKYWKFVFWENWCFWVYCNIGDLVVFVNFCMMFLWFFMFYWYNWLLFSFKKVDLDEFSWVFLLLLVMFFMLMFVLFFLNFYFEIIFFVLMFNWCIFLVCGFLLVVGFISSMLVLVCMSSVFFGVEKFVFFLENFMDMFFLCILCLKFFMILMFLFLMSKLLFSVLSVSFLILFFFLMGFLNLCSFFSMVFSSGVCGGIGLFLGFGEKLLVVFFYIDLLLFFGCVYVVKFFLNILVWFLFVVVML